MVVFSWMIFLINPFVGVTCTFIGLLKDRKNSVHYSIMAALFFASLAYWFIPNHEMDLTRYFLQLSIYSNLSWKNFVSTVLLKNILVIQELLFYLVSKTNNFHLLPAIVIFITYFLIFYMITDYSNRNRIKSERMILSITFIICVLPFPSLISNVRNILSFVLFGYAVYRDVEQNKKNILTYLLYVLPIFIHISAVALLIIRFLLPLYNSSVKKIAIALMFINATFILGEITNLIQHTVLGNNRIINVFFTKANNYINNTESAYSQYLQDNLFMILQKIYFIAVVIFFLIILYIMNKNIRLVNKCNKKQNFSNPSKILSFIELLGLIVIGTAPIVLTVYMRFVFLTVILSSMIVLNKNNYIKKKYQKDIISISLFMIALGGILQQLAFAYKMTNILNMIGSVMTRSLINMFFM